MNRHSFLARVYLWEGSAASKEQARALATELIAMNETNETFAWVVDNMVNDRGLYAEQFFGLNVYRLSDYTLNYLELEFKPTDYLAIHLKIADLGRVYELDAGGGVDLRYGRLYYISAENNAVPLKIVNDAALPRVSMIRLPELYYIAAECYGTAATPDYAEAKRFLRAVREKRGLVTDFACDDATSFREELRKEYLKEFVAEGQLFFYYKRIGQEVIVAPDGTTFEMDDAKYNFPFPSFEIQSGRIQ